MRPGSAAAARQTDPPGEGSLETRLRRLLARADRVGEGRLAARLLPALHSPPGGGGPAPEEGFYWLRHARWLAESFGLLATREGRALYEDLRWVQYCVYAMFRVQDDLVDGDSDEALLAVEANQLSVEAARRAAAWFGGESPFWRVFQDGIDRTSRAIVALDDLQRRPEREPHVDLAHYVDLAASLQIASAGLACAAGRERDWNERISPALDQLAVAGQILDDVEDLDRDLAAGRVNYAAWWLSRPVSGATPEALQALVAFNLATGDRLSGLLEVARERVRRAAAALGPTVCPAIGRYLAIYRRGIDTLESEITTRRGELFGNRRAA